VLVPFTGRKLHAFNEILSQLISMEDKRAGSLLLAYAQQKRREGKKDETLNMYAELMKNFPHYREDALWGIAWNTTAPEIIRRHRRLWGAQ